VRRDTDENWQAYLRRLMQEAGKIEPGGSTVGGRRATSLNCASHGRRDRESIE